jgi:hypothetical protein
MISDRFVIFSLSRSGSSTLRNMLECHPQVRCAHEPLNPSTRHGKKYGCRIEDEAALEAALAEIWKRYNGIKHVWNCNGIPFGMPAERQCLNRHLLTVSNARVIFLKRRNVLKRIVSGELSHQVGKWSSTSNSRRVLRRHRFKPLDLGWIRWQLVREFAAIAAYREHLVSSQIPFFDLWYEDLYGESDLSEGSLRKLHEVISFLELREFDGESWSRMMRLLDPLRTRVNSKATYRQIPNIEEVERILGADDTGWLLR